MSVWLIGSGPMALDYAKVLRALDADVVVVGRGEESAAKFEAAARMPVVRGGLSGHLAKNDHADPEAAIVSVGVEALATATRELLHFGVKRILVEKPAGLDSAEVCELNAIAQAVSAQVFVAYNRRYYAAVRHARAMLESDGGVTSFNFEFTEWSHEIATLQKAPGVKEHWLLANSSHVIDLAFFVGGGHPAELHAMHAGKLDWHAAGAVFTGAGRTRSALFSYQANWDAPGRWGLEVCSRNYRCIFRPMESLQVMKRGSVAIEPIVVADAEIDQRFKPGLYRQTEAFLTGSGAASLCRLSDHVSMLPVYDRIAGY